MLIKIFDSTVARESEVTPEKLYHSRHHLSRRAFVGEGIVLSVSAAASGLLGVDHAWAAAKAFEAVPKSKNETGEELTPFKDISTYNNYYEFGTGKSDPAKNAENFKTKPWKITVEGEVEKPASYDLEDFLKPYKLQECIYRMRCVEGWSMVIPWIGFPIADLIKIIKPTSRAKFIEFTTLNDKTQMPGQHSRVLDWPYVEALRLDEAMHPLAILAVGLYGDTLPNQNGAPLRLVVPWKYGFKGAKAIVKIRLTEKMPRTTWNLMAPTEYGFYANVNPKVDHPRWSQAKERRIGELFKRKTLPFNGYEQVASLYTGMDLKKDF